MEWLNAAERDASTTQEQQQNANLQVYYWVYNYYTILHNKKKLFPQSYLFYRRWADRFLQLNRTGLRCAKNTYLMKYVCINNKRIGHKVRVSYQNINKNK